MPIADEVNLFGLQTDPSQKDRHQPIRWVVASLAAHGLLLSLFLLHRPAVLTPSQLPGDRNGHQLLLTYLPGGGDANPQAAVQPKPAVAPDPLPKLRAPTPPPAPSAHTALAVNAQSTEGSDSLGQGDIQIASLLVHPRPAPDLSQLPAGTRGDVVVDIVIDTEGRVAKSTVERGLGHGVDDAVLATIQGWTFQPAMRNGMPIASEQELLFHYEHG
jgi:protein TonB